MKKFIIIDTPAILHRTWHAIPLLKDKRGRIVNALYGFLSILMKTIAEQKPDYLALTFDRKEPTFRHKEFKEYKAQRIRQPQEFYDQFPLVKEIAAAFGIPIFEQPGFEADDLIGTLTDRAEKDKNVESIVVTGDLDTLQLIDNQTKVLSLKKGVTDTMLYDEAAVKERYGLKPAELIDYRALRGDPSDNIPGIRGIGEKTALELIKKFGNIEKIYKFIKSFKPKKDKEKIRPKILELLKTQKEAAILSKHLVTIVRNVPIKFDLKNCALENFNRAKIVSLFEEFGFKSLIKRLPPEPKLESQGSLFSPKDSSATPSVSKNLKIINSKDGLEAIIPKIQKRLALRSCREGLGIAISDSENYFIPWQVCLETPDFISLLESRNVAKLGHDLKKDLRTCKERGINLVGLKFDLMIAAYLLNAGERTNDFETIIFNELSETAHKAVANGSAEAASLGASYIYKLAPQFETRLKEINGEKVFTEIELPLLPVLSRMEEAGILLDIPFLKNLSAQFSQRIAAIQKQAFELAGESFNLNSPQQIKQILFEKLGISPAGIRKTKTGVSTAASELEKLRGKHPLVDLIFEHRELAKLKSTYIDALPALADENARVHTSFNQTITATGRLSSSNPNLQNIPIRTNLGKEIRRAFIAPRGWKILSADYSQVELRIVASLANDKNMLAAFAKNEDIHLHTAAEIWGVPHDKVTKEMRRAAKAVNFGIVYGIGPQVLAESAGISFNEAKEFIKKYFQVYSGIKNYIDETKAVARSLGFVETLFGRRRYLPEIVSEIPQLRAAAERMATNMPVQGTSADIIKLAMIKIDAILQKIPEKMRLLLQVHDELVFEVRENFLHDGARLVRDLMEMIYKLKVPLKVDIETGDSWGEIKKI